MEPKKTDLRVVRTRKAIRDAFCSMIMEMDYPEITIKELTRRAMINRNTFYLHYDSMDALLRELQAEIAGEFIEKQVSYTKMSDIRRMIRVFFEYMSTQSPLQDRLLCSGSYQFFYDRINQQVMGHRKLMNRGAFGMDEHHGHSLPPVGGGRQAALSGRGDRAGHQADLRGDVQRRQVLRYIPLLNWR